MHDDVGGDEIVRSRYGQIGHRVFADGGNVLDSVPVHIAAGELRQLFILCPDRQAKQARAGKALALSRPTPLVRSSPDGLGQSHGTAEPGANRGLLDARPDAIGYYIQVRVLDSLFRSQHLGYRLRPRTPKKADLLEKSETRTLAMDVEPVVSGFALRIACVDAKAEEQVLHILNQPF